MTTPLPQSFYNRHVATIAEKLIGKLLCRRSRKGFTAGRIIETEAYLSRNDSAAHSYKSLNRKNASMFGPPGRAYVYTIHARQCFNVVTEAEGIGSAVLIRAVEPLQGLSVMRRRRGTDRDKDLCRGPARLTEAFDIGRNLDGYNLTNGRRLWLSDDNHPPLEISKTVRIGVTSAKYLRLRFIATNSHWLSGPRSLNRVTG